MTVKPPNWLKRQAFAFCIGVPRQNFSTKLCRRHRNDATKLATEGVFSGLCRIAEARGVGLAAGWNYVASMYVIADRLDAERRSGLAEQLAAAADSQPRLLAGVSEAQIAGLSVRVLAKSAVELRDYLERIWGAARAELVNRSAPALRRY